MRNISGSLSGEHHFPLKILASKPEEKIFSQIFVNRYSKSPLRSVRRQTIPAPYKGGSRNDTGKSNRQATRRYGRRTHRCHYINQHRVKATGKEAGNADNPQHNANLTTHLA